MVIIIIVLSYAAQTVYSSIDEATLNKGETYITKQAARVNFAHKYTPTSGRIKHEN